MSYITFIQSPASRRYNTALTNYVPVQYSVVSTRGMIVSRITTDIRNGISCNRISRNTLITLCSDP